MLKILGRRNSSNVQKVLWACDELHLSYEREDVGGEFGHNLSAKYLSMNPNGTIPTLIDSGRALWESNAIVRYLCESRDPHGLLPEDVWSIALAQQWMDWQQTIVAPAIRPLFWNLIRTSPKNQDLEAISTARNKTEAALRILDDHLSRHKYVTGNYFSFGDIPVGVMAFRWFNLDIQRASLPNLEHWYQRLTARQAFEDNVMMTLS
jgi:glutathione S-transferase